MQFATFERTGVRLLPTTHALPLALPARPGVPSLVVLRVLSFICYAPPLLQRRRRRRARVVRGEGGLRVASCLQLIVLVQNA